MAEGGSFNEVSVDGPKECRIIAIGKVGNGKSRTGNSLLGKDAFISRCAGKAVTERCQSASASRFGKKVIYIDTPGLFEIERSKEAIEHEISKAIGLSSPGPHAFLFITKVDRFTQEDKDTIDICEKLFGKEFYKHLVVVFTHKKMLDEDKMTIQQFIDEAPSDLKDFLTENNLVYIAIENSSSPDEKEEQMHALFSLIEDVVKKNKGNHFTNTTYVQTEGVLLQEENRRRQSRKASLVNSISQMEATLKKVKISVGAQKNAELITIINQLEKDHHKMKCELAQIQRELKKCPNEPGMFRDDVRREIESSKLIHVIKQIGVVIEKLSPIVIPILAIISRCLLKK